MTAELALKLVTLVAPNYPFLKSTTIPVLDPTACALQGTPEQRQTAASVRRAVEEILELEEEDPIRQHFQERIYTPLSARVGPPSSASEHQKAPATAPAARQLPTEILQHILSYMLLDEEDDFDDLELVCLQQLRLTSKLIKSYMETRFPHTFTRHICRVVASLIHDTERHPHVAKDGYSASALLQQARTLLICVHGDEQARLNELLPAFVYLEHLFVFAPSDTAHIGGLHLDRNVHLREVDISDTKAFDFVTERDLHAERKVDGNEVDEWSGSPTFGPRNLERCQVSGAGLYSDMLESVYELVRSTKLASLTLRGGTRMLDESSLMEADCTKKLVLRGGFTVDTAEALDLGEREYLRELDFSDNLLNDPEVLNLGTNNSLASLDLSFNPLKTFAFHIGANTTLRLLNLAKCIAKLSSERKRDLLGDLARQLRTNFALRHLLLDGNGIDDAALEDFDLSDNVGLRTLSLNRNKRMSSAGLRSLNFSTHPKLREVYVADTQVDQRDTAEFATNKRRIVTKDE